MVLVSRLMKAIMLDILLHCSPEMGYAAVGNGFPSKFSLVAAS